MYWQYGGKYAEDLAIHPKLSKARMNRIFTDVETMIPILTSESPESILVGVEDNQVKSDTQKACGIAWDKFKMQQKIQTLSRHWLLFRLGVIKYRWEKGKGFVTENVLTKKMGFDRRATCKGDCEFMWEEMEDKVEDLMDRFPKSADALKTQFGDKVKTKIKYYEFWGGHAEWVCWKYDKIIFDKMKNPNFDYEDKTNNIFEEPQFPYIFLNVFNLGDDNSLYDDTSLVEESIPAQDGINDLERLIIDLNKGRKRTWIVDGSAVSEKVAQSLTNETGDFTVRCNDAKGNVTGAVNLVQPGVPDNGMFNNLLELLNEVDNIFGIHSTTKGSQEHQETAKGRQLLMSSDYGRIDMVVRNIEDMAEDWFNAFIHMHKVYSSSPITIESEDGSIKFDASTIPYGAKAIVKRGSTLPSDEITKRDSAMELSKLGLMNPETLYDELGYPNPEEMANKLYDWLIASGKLQNKPGQAQPPMGQPSVQPGGQGGQGEAAKSAGVKRINDMLQSPKFQQLPDDQKQGFINDAKAAMSKIQGNQPQ